MAEVQWAILEKNLITAGATLNKYNRGNQEIFIISSLDGKLAVRTSSHFPIFIYEARTETVRED